MDRIVEKISDNIIHIIYPLQDGLTAPATENTPLNFSWQGRCVLTQSLVSFMPKTEYSYAAGEGGFKKKMTANGEVSYAEGMHRKAKRLVYSVDLEFDTGHDEMLLGLGQYEDGIMDYRDHKEYLYESNMRIAIPFLVTTGHYGILIDSESCQIFKSGRNTIKFTIDSELMLSYYVFLGEDIKSIIRCYHELTGMPSMLPRWAFGYIQSKERYGSAEELLEVAGNFRDKNIPIDCIVQDWYTWEEGLWGEKKFDKKRYPDLKKTVDDLHEKNIHFMVSIWPNMSPDSDNYAEFAKADLLMPNSNLYDAFDEKARDLYWKQCREEIMGSGTDALWCDNAEPFSDADWSGEKKKPEKERYLVVTDTSKESMDWDKINSYGLYHAKGIYENWRKSYPKKRVVNLTRSGYTGVQKYGVILWSGDITATYDTLRRQIVEGVKMGLTGIPYWTLDIGGFFVVNDKYENRGCNDKEHLPLWFWRGDYNDGVRDLGYRELYVRWFEFGTFLPIFRSHGTDTPREPWQFKDDALDGSDGCTSESGNVFYDAIVSHIRLRYSLIPYLYSLGAMAHREGSIMMRSLVMEYPDDERVRTVADEYMLGPSLLIAPVYTPMYYLAGSVKIESSDKTRKVYLPAGNGWYDFYTGEFYEGGQEIDADAPLEHIPVFVREGSIIPFSDDISYADEKDGMVSKVRVYEGRDCEFTLYFDKGDGYEFEEGQFSLVKLSFHQAEHKLSVSKTGDYPVDESFETEYITPAIRGST
ncbi:MAG: DUF5110 domain-containing protein [Lachnospiraceae bacterium]|nr:DUF5110 domain-containing protein [Lachnospiraceae bacterium]